jgi:hypothetical protein
MTISSGSAALASDLLNALDAGGQISPTAATELTIASGSITVTQLYHTVDTQSDASSDDLDTIAGGAEMDWLIIRPDHDARSIVVKHDEDNISCMGQADITLDDVEDCCLLFYDAGLTKWLAAPLTPAPVVASGLDFILITQDSGSGNDGGTFTSGADRTHVLDTENADAGGHASVGSNQITLAAGTYQCFIGAVAYTVDKWKCWLYNTTGSASLVNGSTVKAVNSGINSVGQGRFTISESSVLELRCQCETTMSTTGFGQGSSFDGLERYAWVALWKE